MDRRAWWATAHKGQTVGSMTEASQCIHTPVKNLLRFPLPCGKIFASEVYASSLQVYSTIGRCPGESQGWGSLVGCCLWGHAESDTTEATQQQQVNSGKESFTHIHQLFFRDSVSNQVLSIYCEFGNWEIYLSFLSQQSKQMNE